MNISPNLKIKKDVLEEEKNHFTNINLKLEDGLFGNYSEEFEFFSHERSTKNKFLKRDESVLEIKQNDLRNIKDRFFILGDESPSEGYSYFEAENINIPSSVNYLHICHTKIKGITIPDSCIRFYLGYNSELIKLNLNENKATYFETDSRIGESDMRGCFRDNKKLEELILPKKIKSISANAFSGCSSLKNLVIPKTVTSIGSSVFWWTHLEILILLPTIAPSCGYDPMNWASSSLRKIYVPDESLELYKIAEYWSKLSDRIYPLSELKEDNPDLKLYQ